jgi:hypothetical protein
VPLSIRGWQERLLRRNIVTHFLSSQDKTEGYKLEDILVILRADIVKRSSEIIDDHRPEAAKVLENNIKIMAKLSECIDLANDSTSVLNRAFGPAQDGKHRIGNQHGSH